MLNNKKVTIIIPSVNDQKTIGRLIKDLYKYSSLTPEILVVLDSKTTDNTASVAKKMGAQVINIGKSHGKGYAFRKSIKYVKNFYTVQIDSDYQFLPIDINKIINPLINGYDLTLGTRYEYGSRIEPGSVSTAKKYGSYFLSLITSILIGQRVTDIMAGYKGFRSESLIKINPRVNHFGYEAEMIINAKKLNLRIKNIPIGYKKRIVGVSSVSVIKHGLLVLETIIKTKFL